MVWATLKTLNKLLLVSKIVFVVLVLISYKILDIKTFF